MGLALLLGRLLLFREGTCPLKPSVWAMAQLLLGRVPGRPALLLGALPIGMRLSNCTAR